mmetsp:Transcript_43088/g.93849  ORF Transcript_43088/g.93849 Transcript_43088/m.93849 type:complete len:170 (+) Transcript_43088:70-579(+)
MAMTLLHISMGALLMAVQVAAESTTIDGSGYMVFGPISVPAAYSYKFEVTSGVNVDVFVLNPTAYENYQESVRSLSFDFDTSQAGVKHLHLDTRLAEKSVTGDLGNTYIVLDNTLVGTRTLFSSTTVDYTVSGISLGNGAFVASSGTTRTGLSVVAFLIVGALLQTWLL